jgi:hypothetical protein
MAGIKHFIFAIRTFYIRKIVFVFIKIVTNIYIYIFEFCSTWFQMFTQAAVIK